MKNPKSKRSEAERAGEHYLIQVYDCVVTVRSIKTKFQRQDMFASDVIGKKADGTMVFCQVTAGQDEAVRQRRRKLEKIPWQISDEVLLLQLIHKQDPENARSKKWYFRVHCYEYQGWQVIDTAPIPKAWFKAYKKEV